MCYNLKITMNLKLHSEESEFDSSEEEDQHLAYRRVIENIPLRANCDKFEEDDEPALLPKMSAVQQPTIKNNSCVMKNDSKVSVASKKNLMNAYTFKIGGGQTRRKHDPVSLYQRTSQSWKADRFLKSRGNNK